MAGVHLVTKSTDPKDIPRGLKKKSQRRAARPFVDFDYLDKLSPEELAWLEKYVQEEYRAYFKNDGTDFAAPRSPERKRCYDDNNARNRDIWNQRYRTDEDDDYDKE
jgi:hypothetical protein